MFLEKITPPEWKEEQLSPQLRAGKLCGESAQVMTQTCVAVLQEAQEGTKEKRQSRKAHF